jgi:Inner membrane component of T3SS, cytoplasmic domain
MSATQKAGASQRPQKTLLSRLQEQSRPVASVGTLQIAVVAGRHKGARSDVGHEPTVIGAGLDCDIVLTDIGIKSRHVTLEPRGRGRGRYVAVTAHEPGVIIAGEDVAPGATVVSALPLSLDIGSARIDVTGTVAPAGERTLNMWFALPLAVAAGAGIGALLTWGSAPSMPALSGVPAIRAAAPSGLPAATPTVAVADVRAVMQRQLAATGLDKHIKISQRDNVILAEGNLPHDAYPTWRQVKAAINASSKERLLIADMVKPIEPGDGPRGLIAAVTLGKSPSVMGTNGRRAGIGEMLADGWIVRQITTDDVQLERGGNRVTIKLSP